MSQNIWIATIPAPNYCGLQIHTEQLVFLTMNMNFDELLKLMNETDVDPVSLEPDFVRKISFILDQDIKVSFHCPDLNEEDGGNKYITFQSNSSSAVTEEISGEDLEDPDDGYVPRVISFKDLDDHLKIQPRLVLWFSTTPDPKEIDDADAMIQAYLRNYFQLYFAKIRLHIIASRIGSNDLGSYLFKLLHNTVNGNTLNELMGAEAASVFALDGVTPLIRLRGTTGLRTQTRMQDIYFHVDDEEHNIPHVFNTQNPCTAYLDGEPIQNGRSTEKVRRHQYSKLYWPVQIRKDTAYVRRESKHQCVGVIRLVNFQSDYIEAAPFPWTRMIASVFLAETLWVMCEGYLSVEDAAFNSDAAYHGATSLVDSVVKNVSTLRSSLFTISDSKTDARFKIVAKQFDSQSEYYIGRFRELFDKTYASARAIGYQIERTKTGFKESSDSYTDNFIQSVIVRALNTIEDIKISYSISDPVSHTDVEDLRKLIPVNLKIRGSSKALYSLFVNLFENCVKYRKPGNRIEIHINIKIDFDSIIVDVDDRGIGLEAGEEEKIFTRGYRTLTARDQIVRGNGLGLAWCKQIVEFHKGKIKAIILKDGLRIRTVLKEYK